MQKYTEGKLSASNRRVLITKWVGQAWAEVGSSRDMVVRSFKKCGISLSLDGSENGEVHIEGIENYEMPSPNGIDEFQLDDLSDDSSDESSSESSDESSSDSSDESLESPLESSLEPSLESSSESEDIYTCM